MGNIFSANFNIIDFVGEEDWNLDEPAPYFDLTVGFYLAAGVHYAEYGIAEYDIEYDIAEYDIVRG